MTSVDSISLSELKQAVHKADILARPNVIICNPKDEEKLKNALDDMNVFLIRPYEAVEQGKTYVINRYKLERELFTSNLKYCYKCGAKMGENEEWI